MNIPITIVEPNKDPQGTVTSIWKKFHTNLKNFDHRKPPTEEPNVPCGTCKGCCRDIGLVELSPGDSSQLKRQWVGDKVCLPRKENGDCVYLEENGCSVYDIRPVTCRYFDCRLYQIAGTLHKDTSTELNTTIQNWDLDKLYATKEDKIRGIATRLAFNLAKDHPILGGDPIIAFTMHERFMAKARQYFKELKRRGKI